MREWEHYIASVKLTYPTDKPEYWTYTCPSNAQCLQTAVDLAMNLNDDFNYTSYKYTVTIFVFKLNRLVDDMSMQEVRDAGASLEVCRTIILSDEPTSTVARVSNVEIVPLTIYNSNT